jgi:hypothetical protein
VVSDHDRRRSIERHDKGPIAGDFDERARGAQGDFVKAARILVTRRARVSGNFALKSAFTCSRLCDGANAVQARSIRDVGRHHDVLPAMRNGLQLRAKLLHARFISRVGASRL